MRAPHRVLAQSFDERLHGLLNRLLAPYIVVDFIEMQSGYPQLWDGVDLGNVTPDTYPPTLHDREQWMGRLAGEKLPFAPWGGARPPRSGRRRRPALQVGTLRELRDQR
jgi:hypothetical protein